MNCDWGFQSKATKAHTVTRTQSRHRLFWHLRDWIAIAVRQCDLWWPYFSDLLCATSTSGRWDGLSAVQQVCTHRLHCAQPIRHDTDKLVVSMRVHSLDQTSCGSRARLVITGLVITGPRWDITGSARTFCMLHAPVLRRTASPLKNQCRGPCSSGTGIGPKGQMCQCRWGQGMNKLNS